MDRIDWDKVTLPHREQIEQQHRGNGHAPESDPFALGPDDRTPGPSPTPRPRPDLVNTQFLSAQLDRVQEPEFVLDGIIEAGCVLLAGGWGVGKTSQLIPLLFRAAHLCAPDDPLRPTLRRRVIYLAEDIGQARRIVQSMKVAGELDGIDPAEIDDFFKLVAATRLLPHQIIKAEEVYAELAVNHETAREGEQFTALPLIVFDTRSANIEIENESDNSQAAQAIATLRQGFPGYPMIIVTHIAKALRRAELADLSGRGAGAWEADCQQVMYLVNDEGERWLEIASPKHRFVAKVDGVAFDTISTEVQAYDVLGNPVQTTLVHGRPKAVALGERMIEKAKRDEAEKKDQLEELRTALMQQAREWRKASIGFNRSKLRNAVAGHSMRLIIDMIDTLIDERWLVEREIPSGQRVNNSRKNYLIVLSSDEREAYRSDFTLPPELLAPPVDMVKRADS